MKLTKRLTMFLISILLLTAVVPVYAETAGEVITLEQAQEMTRKNSRDLESLLITRESLKLNYEMAKKNYEGRDIDESIDSYIDLIDRTESRLENTADPAERARLTGIINTYKAKIKGLEQMLPTGSAKLASFRAYVEAKNAYNDAEKQISDVEETLDYTIGNLYLSLLEVERQLATQKRNLVLQGELLKIERQKVSLGLSTASDEQSVAVIYNQLDNAIDSLQDQRAQLIWKLNNLMGRTLNLEFKVTQLAISPTNSLISYEELLNEATKNNLNLTQKERAIDDYHSYVNKSSDSKQKEVYRNTEEITNIELAGMKEELKQNVKMLTDSFQNAYSSWEAAGFAKNKAELSYKNDKIKYEQGLISRIQLMASEVSYFEAVNGLQKAAEDWYLANCKIELAKKGVFI